MYYISYYYAFNDIPYDINEYYSLNRRVVKEQQQQLIDYCKNDMKNPLGGPSLERNIHFFNKDILKIIFGNNKTNLILSVIPDNEKYHSQHIKKTSPFFILLKLIILPFENKFFNFLHSFFPIQCKDAIYEQLPDNLQVMTFYQFELHFSNGESKKYLPICYITEQINIEIENIQRGIKISIHDFSENKEYEDTIIIMEKTNKSSENLLLEDNSETETEDDEEEENY